MVQTGDDIFARVVSFICTDQSNLFYNMDYSPIDILALIK
jgi:hypothetical protein